MADTGWLIAVGGRSDSSKGAVAWSTPGNVTASDNAYAQVGLAANESEWCMARYLKTVSIPNGAAIRGVEVKAEIRSNGTATVVDLQMYNGAEFIGTAKNPGTVVPASDTELTWGSPTDLWDVQWVFAQPGCGFEWGIRIAEAVSGNSRIDAMYVKFYYDFAGRGPGFINHGGPDDNVGTGANQTG